MRPDWLLAYLFLGRLGRFSCDLSRSRYSPVSKEWLGIGILNLARVSKITPITIFRLWLSCSLLHNESTRDSQNKRKASSQSGGLPRLFTPPKMEKPFHVFWNWVITKYQYLIIKCGSWPSKNPLEIKYPVHLEKGSFLFIWGVHRGNITYFQLRPRGAWHKLPCSAPLCCHIGEKPTLLPNIFSKIAKSERWYENLWVYHFPLSW